jgi:hypothetical protein
MSSRAGDRRSGIGGREKGASGGEREREELVFSLRFKSTLVGGMRMKKSLVQALRGSYARMVVLVGVA